VIGFPCKQGQSSWDVLVLWQSVEEIQVRRSSRRRQFVDFQATVFRNRPVIVDVTGPVESMPQESVFKL